MQGLKISFPGAHWLQVSVLVVGLGLLGGCAGAPGPDGINDPYEATNRRIHDFNRGLDRALVGPAAKGYGSIVPKPVTRVVGNLAGTLDLPGDIANNLLQLRIADAAQNTLRLGVNLTMGVGGIFDASTALGLLGKPTDFGETLHVWGFPEGAYGELPLIGPSTSRDTVGRVVDVVLNPLRLALPAREGNIATAASVASRLGDRFKFGTTVDSILYDSADSYAQSRLLYLQNRRFELGQATGGTSGEEGFLDPYEEK